MMLSAGNRRPGRQAFTLVELVLVLALLVVVMSMVAPRMSGFVRGRALDSEARRMIALMHAAQSRAVSEGMPVVFWVDEKQGQYGMVAETPPASGDPKAENLTVAGNLELAVLNTGGTALFTYHNLPAIRFATDGSVDENSPHIIRISSMDGGSLWLMESRNRTGYEVQDTGN